MLKRVGVALIAYLTNHVISQVPFYTLRHAWYRTVLGARIGHGAGVAMGQFIWFFSLSQVRRDGFRIGADSLINRDCTLDARGPLHIGAHVSISPQVAILTTQHGVGDPAFRTTTRPVSPNSASVRRISSFTAARSSSGRRSFTRTLTRRWG